MKVSINIECSDLEEPVKVKAVLAKISDNKTPEVPSVKETKQHEPVKLERSPGKRLIPVSKWEDYHPWPSTSGLRYLIFFGDTNGFNNCIRRVGRRILLDEEAFFEWVENKITSMLKKCLM